MTNAMMFEEFIGTEKENSYASALILTDNEYDEPYREQVCRKIKNCGVRYLYFTGAYMQQWKDSAEKAELRLQAEKALAIPSMNDVMETALLKTPEDVIEEIEYQSRESDRFLILYDDAEFWASVKKHIRTFE